MDEEVEQWQFYLQLVEVIAEAIAAFKMKNLQSRVILDGVSDLMDPLSGSGSFNSQALEVCKRADPEFGCSSVTHTSLVNNTLTRLGHSCSAHMRVLPGKVIPFHLLTRLTTGSHHPQRQTDH